jgi:hypothetical protein
MAAGSLKKEKEKARKRKKTLLNKAYYLSKFCLEIIEDEDNEDEEEGLRLEGNGCPFILVYGHAALVSNGERACHTGNMLKTAIFLQRYRR